MKLLVLKCRPTIEYPFIAWLIMIFQGMLPWSEEAWSHMAVSIDDTVYHITGNGFQVDSLHCFEGKYKIVDTAVLEVEAFDYYYFMYQQKDKRYDKLQIFGLMWKALGFVTYNTAGKNFKKLICSELILNLLVVIYGIEIGDSDNYDLNMTWDLVKGLESV